MEGLTIRITQWTCHVEKHVGSAVALLKTALM
jgi:hypothetical protein